MPRGGAREGAGRKKGTPNKITADTRAAVAASGETPKDYMLRIMRDEQAEQDRRDKMAVAVAPYCDPKLQAVEHTGPDGGPIQNAVTVIERVIVRKSDGGPNAKD